MTNERRPAGAASGLIAASRSIVTEIGDTAHKASRMDLPSGVDLAIRRHVEAVLDLLRPRCDRCSRPLSDPVSVARGLGHVCASRAVR